MWWQERGPMREVDWSLMNPGVWITDLTDVAGTVDTAFYIYY